MPKIILDDLTSIQNDPTAVDTINDNSTILEDAFDRVLFRDGTAPNNMNADLDMNSHKILNLPAPRSPLEPARLKDIVNKGEGVGIPSGGLDGQVLTKASNTDYDVDWETPIGVVTSVFGRTGAVTAQSNDYTFSQIGSKPTTLSGYGITDAQPLDSDLTAIAALTTAPFGRSVLTETSATTLKTTLSLQNVDNTSDANKPVSTATQTALNLKANIASPTLTGTPASTTAAVDTNTTQIATTAYVIGQASSVTPLGTMPTAIVGTSTRYARADHIHPGREVLTANRTYYVDVTLGNDANSGLAAGAGNAWKTRQKAIDVIAALDLSIYNVVVNLADGTYTDSAVVSGPWLGNGNVDFVGNTTNPQNVIINPASGGGFQVSGGGFIRISGMELRAQFGIIAQRGSRIYGMSALRFGAAANYQIYANGGQIIMFNNYSIVGAAQVHVLADAGGSISATGLTINITGTPAYSVSYANAGAVGSSILYYSNTFTGTGATGTRFIVQQGALVNSNGGGANYFPGNAAGAGTNFGVAPWGLYQ